MSGISANSLYDIYEKSQWWDHQKLMAYQQNMLGALLRHAHAQSPYYKFRLSPVFSRSGEINWDGWRDIPILTRQDIVKYGDKMQAMRVPSEHAPVSTARTSGSTGHPITIKTTRFLRSAILATGWRAQKWYDVDWSLSLLTRTYTEVENLKTGDAIGSWGPPQHSASRRGRNFYCFDVTMDDFFDLMLTKKPAYVSIYSGSIEILCEIAQARKLNAKLRMFFSRGGSVSEALRQSVFQNFGAGILEGYSTQECGSIGYACPTGSGIHINAETVYVEIIKDDGTLAFPGEEGRVVVTPMTSTAMPLIRYDLGDRAVLGGPCSCGRGLPLLKSISGKVTHAFRHPDGRVQMGARAGRLRDLLGISRWQVAQIGPTHFDVRYVAENEVNDQNKQLFTKEFQNLLFSDSTVTFTRVAEIPLSKSGKFIEYINEWHQVPD